jgi:DNA-binding beta-propeller fold protein YncE
MRSDYRSVLVALGLAGIWMMLLSVGVQAQTYGPPYVIGLRGTGEGLITQQGNSVAIDPVQNYAYALTENSVTVFSDTQIVKSFSSIGSPIAIAAAPVKGMAYVTLDTDRIRFIQGERLLTTTI